MSEMNSQEIGKLMEALAKAQAVMEGAREDSANPFFKSTYADLGSVWRACRKPLSENGLAVVQTVDQMAERSCLVTILGHSSGQWIKSVMVLPLVKLDAQSIGSALTYCRRYALAAIVGVAPADDDGEAAMVDIRRTAHAPIKKEEESKFLTSLQIKQIEDKIGGNKDLMKRLLRWLTADDLKDVGRSEFDAIMATLDKAMAKDREIA